jgi:hypothetical protein
MCEAIELMRMTPDNLGFDAFDTFNKEFPHLEVPLELLDARHEFECYQFYFVTFFINSTIYCNLL